MPMNQQEQNIRTYLTLWKISSRDSFIRRFKEPFLLQVWTAQSETDIAQFSFPTAVGVGGPSADTGAIGADGGESTLVFRVVKKPGTAYAGMVTIGRTANNDIVLAYQEVSKFHGYFSKDSDSEKYYLTDASSTNGTFVNGCPLTPREKCEVGEGDTICFGGALAVTLHSSGAFFDVLTNLAG